MTNGITNKMRPRRSFEDRLASAVARQSRIIVALFIRETRTRFGYSLLGYSWVLIEPATNVLFWVLMFNLMQRLPPLGESMLIFVATAFFPMMLFRNMTGMLTSAISANRSLLQFPIVHNIDVIFARTLLETSTALVIFLLYFGLFGIFGLQWLPAHPVEMLGVLALIALFGFGIGTCNAVLACLFPSWPKIYGWVQRVFYITCGLFFLPGSMLPTIRDVLAYLPLTHAIDWFRQSFFAGYESSFLSKSYIISIALASMFTGLALERVLRRRISVVR